LGAVLTKLGELEPASKQLEAAVRLDPSSTQAHFRLATVLRSLGLQDEARKELDAYKVTSSKKIKDDIATTKSSHAEALLRSGDARGAADSYRDAIEENPADPRLFVGLALALDRYGDVDGERRALAKAVQIDPRLAVAHNQLGVLNLQVEKIAEAEQEFKTAISLRPHYAQAENNLGTLYGQQGDDAKAERYFRHAIDSDPGYVQAFVNLGATLASESRFAEAEETVLNAIHIDPDSREAKELLTMIRSRVDQANRAH
jgi:Tfp pilus assembly protein PilF